MIMMVRALAYLLLYTIDASAQEPQPGRSLGAAHNSPPAPSLAASVAYAPPDAGAQCNQDRWIYRNVFAHLPTPDGIFIEFGARDGLKHSNTLFFERALGWEGLLVEAGGDDWAGLRGNRRCRLRGRAGCAHAALSDLEDREVFHHECSGGSCRHTVADARGDARAKPVRTATLDGMLARRGVSGVDLLCADCEMFPRLSALINPASHHASSLGEGCELAALRGFDFAKHRPSVVLLERQREPGGGLGAAMAELRALLANAGYGELHDPAGEALRFQDSLFVRRDLAPRLPAPCLDHLVRAPFPAPCPVVDMPAGAPCARPGAWAADVLQAGDG